MIVAGNTVSRKIKDATGTTVFTNSLLTGNNQCVVVVNVSGSTFTPISFCSVQVSGSIVKSRITNDNDCIVFGFYNGTTNNKLYNFPGNTTPSFTMTANSNNDSFIAKYSSIGVAQWYVRILSNVSDVLNGYAIDGNGHCYACGISQKGTSGTPLLAFNADTTTSTTLETATTGGQNLWAVHYNASGVLQGFALITTSGSETGFSMTVDDTDNAVYMGGYFNPISQTMRDFNGNTIDLSTFSLTFPASSAVDAFVIKLNKSGTTTNTQWMKQIGGSTLNTSEQTNSLCLDSSQNVYSVVVGKNGMNVYSTGATVFATVNPVSGATNYLLALVKYDKTGVPQWVAGFDAGTNPQINGRVTTTTQGVYLLVYNVVNSSINLVKNSSGNIDTNVIALTMTNTSGAFAVLIKYTFAGAYQWHMLFNATTAGTAQINDVFTFNNEVYVDLRYVGTFSCTGVSSLGTGTSSGSVLLKITDSVSSGSATLCTYSDINA